MGFVDHVTGMKIEAWKELKQCQAKLKKFAKVVGSTKQKIRELEERIALLNEQGAEPLAGLDKETIHEDSD